MTFMSAIRDAMYSIIPDRILTFPYLLFTYLPTAIKQDINVTHVFDLLVSDLELFTFSSFPLSPCIITPFRDHKYWLYN